MPPSFPSSRSSDVCCLSPAGHEGAPEKNTGSLRAEGGLALATLRRRARCWRNQGGNCRRCCSESGNYTGGLARAGNSGRGTLRKLQDSEKCESRGWTRPDPALGQGPQAARAGGNRGGSPRTRAQGATGVLTLLLTTRRDPLYCTCMFRSREGCDVFGE